MRHLESMSIRGSLEAMTKGNDARYLRDTLNLKVAQGVVGAMADKGSVLKFIPYTMQAAKHGLQDLGASSLPIGYSSQSSKVRRAKARELTPCSLAFHREMLIVPWNVGDIEEIMCYSV